MTFAHPNRRTLLLEAAATPEQAAPFTPAGILGGWSPEPIEI